MITYKNIIPTLKIRIPEFDIDEEIVDTPIVAFSFLSSFLKESYSKKNYQVVGEIAELINDLVQSDEPEIRGCLDEIAIGLFDESLANYNHFKSRLNEKSAKMFD